MNDAQAKLLDWFSDFRAGAVKEASESINKSNNQTTEREHFCKACDCIRVFDTSLRRQPTGLFRVFVCHSCGHKFAARVTKNRPK